MVNTQIIYFIRSNCKETRLSGINLDRIKAIIPSIRKMEFNLGKEIPLQHHFHGISESLIRNLISRFGPVWVYNSDQTRFQIYYGWNTNSGSTEYLIMYRDYTNILHIESESASQWPWIPYAKFFGKPPVDCTDPQFGCFCTNLSLSDDDCICPITQSVLNDINKTKCDCIQNDSRPSCKICPGNQDDVPDCICPSARVGLINIPISKCGCIADDLRTECFTEQQSHDDYIYVDDIDDPDIEGSELIHTELLQIIFYVALPLLALL
ncbi:MAG: hypothetical protein EZS28_004491 [Streblomastix strix]|uniref:Uncharacterized protein n=1 Tax=Streblomastix strix TaxID=222440 RepID=A0A5J4WZL8_9EUKA|nr:MAG: hypothetical protein EZS28_004491 [Streblomastix strix]